MNDGPKGKAKQKYSIKKERAFLLSPNRASGPQAKQTPLHLACINENLQLIRRLLFNAKVLKILPECLTRKDGTGRTAEDIIKKKISDREASIYNLEAIRKKTKDYSPAIKNQLYLLRCNLDHLQNILDVIAEFRRNYDQSSNPSFKNLQLAILKLGRDENSPLLDKIDTFIKRHPYFLLMKDPDTGQTIFQAAVKVANRKLCDFLLDTAYCHGYLDDCLNARNALGQTPQENLNQRMSLLQNQGKATLLIIIQLKGLPENTIDNMTGDLMNPLLDEYPMIKSQVDIFKARYWLLDSIREKIMEYRGLQKMFPDYSLPSSVYMPFHSVSTATTAQAAPSHSSSSIPSPSRQNQQRL